MSLRPDVLVVGAGPTGLTLALQAHDHGARVRVVERRPEVFRPSRALIVHPRTLEVLRPLGVVDAMLARADTAPGARLHLGSRVVPARLADLALADTAYPHLTLLRQLDVETVLAGALADRGVVVERGTELVALGDTPHGQEAVLRSPSGIEPMTCGSIAGCDGTGSTVRTLAGIGWRGGPYRRAVVLADVELDGDLTPGVVHVVAARRGLLFLFALGERATWRLLATRPAAEAWPQTTGEAGRAAAEDALQRMVDEAGLGVRITGLAWWTRVGLQHRLAARYRQDAVFLAGDAGHSQSPAGGLGMNTGIQDAANLGWKLAFAARSRAPADLLDSYQQERRPAARRIRALTDLLFWAESGTDPVASYLRGVVAPLGAPLLPLLLRRRRMVASAIRVLSQLRLSYRGSPLSVEGTAVPRGWPRAGDRLPDATVTSAGRRVRLHELLARPGVHVLLNRDSGDPGSAVAPGRWLHVHRLTDAPGSGIVAVRPDGYIGFRGGAADNDRLAAWLSLVGVLSQQSASMSQAGEGEPAC